MPVEQLSSLTHVANRFGVDRRTIGDLVRLHEIPTYRMSGTALAKGVDRDGVRKLAKILNRQPAKSAS